MTGHTPFSTHSLVRLKENMTLIKVRKFAPCDGEAMSRIMCESFKGFLKEKMTSRCSAEAYEETAHVKDGQWGDEETLVAESDGKMVGCMHIAIDEKKSWGSLGSIGVDPAYQGGGVGRALFEAAAGLWREKKIKSIHTCVSHINPKALSFYKKMGFMEKGVIKDQFLKGVDEIQLEWNPEYEEPVKKERNEPCDY